MSHIPKASWLPKSLREQCDAPLPEGWERSGATHCTHTATRACVWHSPGLGWWAAPRDAIMPSPPYEKWELRGGFNTRADAMTAALELHKTGGRYVDDSK